MTKNANAVLYLRSSKDRHDVSIEAQRHELGKLAADRGFRIVGEYVDTVESGKDDDRPGFQRLLGDLRARGRAWSAILILDTSRLARRLAAAVKFEEECRPLAVSVVYKSLPQAEEAERALIKAVLHGVDEWHSLVSKRKGLAGMRQNVQAGYRAGGRAPFGYRLEHHAMNAMRDGRPVMKSKLVPGPDAVKVQRYLKARAAGARRAGLVERLGLQKNKSSLVGVEWNALTYAGHTVWNVHAGEPGTKRRPRAEWVIQRDTHEALITEAEALVLLERLEAASVKRPRRTAGDYLFTGLLRTSEGEPWYGEKFRYYRTGNSYAQARDVEQTLLSKVASDLRSNAFSAALVRKARTSYGREFDAEIERLRGAEAALDGRISRYLEIAEKNDLAEPALRKVAELEKDRKAIAREVDQARRDASTAAAARAVREDQVSRMLDAMASDMARLDRDKLKDFLFTICERITLNPATLTARIHYKIPLARRDRLASPREGQAIPHGKAITCVRVSRKLAA